MSIQPQQILTLQIDHDESAPIGDEWFARVTYLDNGAVIAAYIWEWPEGALRQAQDLYLDMIGRVDLTGQTWIALAALLAPLVGPKNTVPNDG